MSLASVVSFCSNDWRFFHECISQLEKVSSQILVTVCDHFFDGTQENYSLLEEFYRFYPHVTFIEFAYDPSESYRSFSPITSSHPYYRHDWHNTGRWISYFFLKSSTDYVLFSDADEIVDAKRLAEWLEQKTYREFSVLRLASFRYFREASFRAEELGLAGVLVRKADLDPRLLWGEHERMGLCQHMPGAKWIDVKGLDGEPMVHHYSWVRSKEEILQKAKCWGHHWERNWKEIIETEYAHPFDGVDFVRQEKHSSVQAPFDPLNVAFPSVAAISKEQHVSNVKLFDNVICVTRQEMFQRELIHEFQLI